jgi:hypothetical protein
MGFFACRASLPFGYLKIAGLSCFSNLFGSFPSREIFPWVKIFEAYYIWRGHMGCRLLFIATRITGEQDRIAPSHLFIKLLVTFISHIKS